MAQRVSAAEAKAHFSDLIARVAHAGERFIVERRGKPVAAIVSIDELERVEREHPLSARPRGALALVGAWADVDEEELDALVADIYRAREQDAGRPVLLED